MAIAIPEDIRQFLQVMGRQGGRARAQKYGKEQLAVWGKRGGRPKKVVTGPSEDHLKLLHAVRR